MSFAEFSGYFHLCQPSVFAGLNEPSNEFAIRALVCMILRIHA
jgi:hypothetical protein